MISAIELENFKGISARQRIEFKPLTLLFGENSAGKSTILHGLLYASEVLLEGNPNADATVLGGSAVRLGGFPQLVYGRNLERMVSVKIEFPVDVALDVPLRGASRALRVRSDEIFSEETGIYPGLDEGVTSLSVEFVVRWDRARGRAQVYRVEIGANGWPPVLIVEAPTAGFNTTITIDARNPVWELAAGPATSPDFERDPSIIGDWLEQSGAANPQNDGCLYLVDAFGTDAASYGREAVHLWFFDENPSEARLSVMAMVNKLLAGGLNAARDVLRELIYIGPLRAVPGGDATTPYGATSWADGLGAWHALAADDDLRAATSRDLRRLGCHYELELCQFRATTGTDPVRDVFTHADRAVWLRDGNGKVLRPGEVGIGISQVVPVLASLASPHPTDYGVVLLEQPELHLHPALQVEMGDALRRAATNRLVIVETHSEHLILRVLRRIRETSAGELPKGAPRCAPEDIGVLHVQVDASGTKISKRTVDAAGEFIDGWPGGFFEERAKELF